MFNKTTDGCENVLVQIDIVTQLAGVVLTQDQTAHTTAVALIKHWFVYLGYAAQLHLDKGLNISV